jgi:hypothetical protein
MKRLIYTLAILTALSVSCYYDSEESLYPDLGNCDTTNVTYTGSILPLMENNCLSCHAANVSASRGGGINLQGYQNVFDFKESIVVSIKQTGPKPMPKNASKLKACLIQQFDIWVAAGAPDN